jgi:hypothetical protein
MKQLAWGVIAYAIGTDRCPEENLAAFNGWYSNRVAAEAALKDMCCRHCDWHVTIVQSDDSLFDGLGRPLQVPV